MTTRRCGSARSFGAEQEDDEVPWLNEYVPVRLSHLLRDCSVGAVVRGPDSLMVVQDTRTWDRPGNDPMDREIRYVERVRSALGLDQALCAPPRSAKRNGTVIGWVPALRFPTWMRCLSPSCGLLHPAPWRSRRRGAMAAGKGRRTGAEEAPVNATLAAAGSSRCPGFSFTKTAISPTFPGTTSPTGNPGTRSSVNAVTTGRSPICN